MAKVHSSQLIIFSILYLATTCLVVYSATFTLENKCDYTVWPGILSGAGTAPLSTTGFALAKGETRAIDVPSSWSGRLWGRTLCSEDSSTGAFTCVTGDCGSNKLECSGSGAAPPATLAEFTLNGYGGQDFYDVSLVDGYNLPMIVSPQGGTGVNCSITGCLVDLNGACPTDLKVLSSDGSESVACKSACEAFAEPQYCCSGEFATPDTCKPSTYSEIFKNACPHAYSYAYDDKSSTFICGSAPDYLITFCAAPNTSKKASKENTTTSTSTDQQPLAKGTMVYEGAAYDASDASPSMCNHVFRSSFFVGCFSILAAIWWISAL